MTELSLSGRQQQRYQGWYCCRWSLSRQPEITGIVDLRLYSGKWSGVKVNVSFRTGIMAGMVVLLTKSMTTLGYPVFRPMTFQSVLQYPGKVWQGCYGNPLVYHVLCHIKIVIFRPACESERVSGCQWRCVRKQRSPVNSLVTHLSGIDPISHCLYSLA